MKSIPVLIVATLFAVCVCAEAPRTSQSSPIITAKAPAFARSGHTFTIDLKITTPIGFHIYGPHETEGLPTKVVFTVPKGFIGAPKFPATVAYKSLAGSFRVYQGTVHIPVVVTPPQRAKGKAIMHLEVTVQACNDRTCMLPTTQKLTVTTDLK